MAHYYEVDSDHFAAFLTQQGFTPSVQRDEVVYSKRFEGNEDLVCKVYSSFSQGAETARDVGKDAIRVIALFDKNGKTFPLFKGARVYRTTSQESVEQRTAARIADAFARCAEWTAKQNAPRPRQEASNGQQALTPQPNTASASKGNVEPAGAYFGELGKSFRETLTVASRKPWNSRFLFVMTDDKGNTFTYWSDKDLLQVGESYNLGFKVRGFKTFQGVKQTDITDVVGKRVVQ